MVISWAPCRLSCQMEQEAVVLKSLLHSVVLRFLFLSFSFVMTTTHYHFSIRFPSLKTSSFSIVFGSIIAVKDFSKILPDNLKTIMRFTTLLSFHLMSIFCQSRDPLVPNISEFLSFFKLFITSCNNVYGFNCIL